MLTAQIDITIFTPEALTALKEILKRCGWNYDVTEDEFLAVNVPIEDEALIDFIAGEYY